MLLSPLWNSINHCRRITSEGMGSDMVPRCGLVVFFFLGEFQYSHRHFPFRKYSRPSPLYMVVASPSPRTRHLNLVLQPTHSRLLSHSLCSSFHPTVRDLASASSEGLSLSYFRPEATTPNAFLRKCVQVQSSKSRPSSLLFKGFIFVSHIPSAR